MKWSCWNLKTSVKSRGDGLFHVPTWYVIAFGLGSRVRANPNPNPNPPKQKEASTSMALFTVINAMMLWHVSHTSIADIVLDLSFWGFRAWFQWRYLAGLLPHTSPYIQVISHNAAGIRTQSVNTHTPDRRWCVGRRYQGNYCHNFILTYQTDLGIRLWPNLSIITAFTKF